MTYNQLVRMDNESMVISEGVPKRSTCTADGRIRESTLVLRLLRPRIYIKEL
jgi:hypothetical protein